MQELLLKGCRVHFDSGRERVFWGLVFFAVGQGRRRWWSDRHRFFFDAGGSGKKGVVSSPQLEERNRIGMASNLLTMAGENVEVMDGENHRTEGANE